MIKMPNDGAIFISRKNDMLPEDCNDIKFNRRSLYQQKWKSI